MSAKLKSVKGGLLASASEMDRMVVNMRKVTYVSLTLAKKVEGETGVNAKHSFESKHYREVLEREN